MAGFWPLVGAGILLLSHGGCAHQPRTSEAKQVGMKEKEYHALTARAHGGDKKAAEKLAKLWYQNEYGTNERTLYSTQIAAQNGSKRAAQVVRYARDQADATSEVTVAN
jgi:hypothetical protein